jgi:Cys-rich four helix bundle protein (predicted Tat secretion target)
MSKDIVDFTHSALSGVSLGRRQALKLTGTLAAGLAGMALASCNWADAQNQDQPARANHESHTATQATKYQDLLDAALMCVNRGQACVDHCIKLLAAGDTSFKDCMGSVSTMLPMCTAVAKFAVFDVSRLKEVVKICVDVCGDCELECRKHEHHHAQCKNCADSCAAFIREGKKMVGV